MADAKPAIMLYKATIECAICMRKWIAFFKPMTKKLECPGCGYWNTAPDTPPSNNATPA